VAFVLRFGDMIGSTRVGLGRGRHVRHSAFSGGVTPASHFHLWMSVARSYLHDRRLVPP
jgi:hypothetical protein